MQKFVCFATPLLLSLLFSSLTVDVAGNDGTSVHFPAGENPYTPKAFLMRYWSKKISNTLPKSSFLLSKASPLSAVDSAAFTKLAAENSLSTRLPEFCSVAKLLCFPDFSPSLERHSKDANFAVYTNRNFTNYGRERVDGTDSFQTYSPDLNIPVGTFRQYSRDSSGHNDKFTNYAQRGNVVDQSFHTYGAGANGGAGKFTTYANDVNVANLGFKSYSRGTNGRTQSFTSYSDDGNTGDQSFANYGKEGNGALNEFTSYGNDSNVVGSTFSSYGKGGNSVNNTFTNYGNDQNVPENTFNNYGRDGNAAVDNFANYRDQANVGDDSFKSYAKNSNGAEVDFTNYGNSFNEGTDKFSGYGKDANDPTVNFKIYGINNTFKDYAKSGVTFSGLPNASSKASAIMADGGSLVNRWVKPGKFFREAMLKEGTTMPMPDIRDKMPKRSFLPRSILSKLPFSSSRISELKKTFHAADDSAMERMIKAALEECERKPSVGETKRCVGSVEDMIDFATSVLGQNVVVRTTENVKGSDQQIMIGSINRINGGKITESVSCHQSLYPYLLYYCHSVPKVRVYEADLLDPKTKAKMNHGVAICHVDTSAWSATHGAFMALGSGPGRIEVCHWIFENDMTWTIADSLQ